MAPNVEASHGFLQLLFSAIYDFNTETFWPYIVARLLICFKIKEVISQNIEKYNIVANYKGNELCN